jgi:TrpR family trp operon transcriptional repressor
MQKSNSEDGWSEFLEICAEVKSAKEYRKFFELFLSIEEREVIASRYLIIKALLKEQLSQREIAAQCGVSISQITRGSNALKIIDSRLRKFLKEKI